MDTVLLVTLFVTISEKVKAPRRRRWRPLWFMHIVLIVILLSLPTGVMVIHLVLILVIIGPFLISKTQSPVNVKSGRGLLG